MAETVGRLLDSNIYATISTANEVSEDGAYMFESLRSDAYWGNILNVDGSRESGFTVYKE